MTELQPGHVSTRPSTALLSAVCAAGPLAMSICVPGLPAIADDLASSLAVVQFVISAFLIGIGFAQPIHGPLTDRFGRRPVLLAAFTLFIVASLACALARSVEALIFGRFVQAVGVGAGTVVARAMVRDTYDPRDSAKIMTYITAATAVAPAVAPAVGGALVGPIGWSAPFWVTAVMGLLLLGWTIASLPETRPATAPTRLDPRRTLRDYGTLLRSPLFLGHSLIFGACNGAFFAFLSVAPSLFRDRLGVSAATFGLLWSGLALAYMVGALVSGRLIGRIGVEATLKLAMLAVFVIGVAWPLIVVVAPFSVPVGLLPIALILMCGGIANPLALAGAVNHFPKIAGSAAGLSSALAMVVSAVFAALGGALYDGTPLPMTLSVALAVGACLAGYGLVVVGERKLA